jgi:signal transduction histidine kinase
MISPYPISTVLTAGIAAFYLFIGLISKKTRIRSYGLYKACFLTTLALSNIFQLVRPQSTNEQSAALLLHGIVLLNITSLYFFLRSYALISNSSSTKNNTRWTTEYIITLVSELSVIIAGVVSLTGNGGGFFYNFDLNALIDSNISTYAYWSQFDLQKSASLFLFISIVIQLSFCSYKSYKNKNYPVSYIIIGAGFAHIINYAWNSSILSNKYPHPTIYSLSGLIWVLFFVIIDTIEIEYQDKEDKKLVKEMKDKELAINTYLSNISVLGALVTQDGRVIASNNLFNTLFAIEANEATVFIKNQVKQCKELISKSEFAQALEFAANGKTSKTELKFTSKEGFAVYYEFIFSKSISVYENNLTIFIEGHNITDIKAKINEIEATKRLQSIGKLASGAAHDFNNIMTAVITLAEISIQEQPTSPTRNNLELIVKASKRGVDITRNLLTFSRSAATNTVNFNLIQIVNESVTLLQSTGSKLVKIDYTTELKEAIIAGDPSEIHNLVINLLINAFDAIKGPGKITIAVDEEILTTKVVLHDNQTVEEGNYYLLSITDSGAGIPKNILHQVFDPFFTTKAYGKGTGLGLAAARETTKAHFGVITIESLENQGTTVYVYLPKSSLIETKEEETSHIASEPASPKLQKSVAILDDDEMVLNAVDKMVKSMGYKTFRFSNAHEFIEWMQAKSHYPNCILLDLNMPLMNGTEVYNKLKQEFSDLKFIIMTGNYENNDHSDFEIAPNVQLLLKPFGIDKLQNTLSTFLKE